MSGRIAIRQEKARRFPRDRHPYRVLEAATVAALPPGGTLLDIGCGRSAERLRRLVGLTGARGIGVDVEPFTPAALASPTTLLRVTETWPLPEASVDVAYSVSVFEHLERPGQVIAEAARVVRPGGTLLVLTPNLWDYVSLASWVVPNRLHPYLVSLTEGRPQQKTFPTYYRANTRTRLERTLRRAGFPEVTVEYRASPPSYLAFHPHAWRLGAAYHRFIAARPATAWLQGWLFAVAKRR